MFKLHTAKNDKIKALRTSLILNYANLYIFHFLHDEENADTLEKKMQGLRIQKL
jgi:hypothetical protein